MGETSAEKCDNKQFNGGPIFSYNRLLSCLFQKLENTLIFR